MNYISSRPLPYQLIPSSWGWPEQPARQREGHTDIICMSPLSTGQKWVNVPSNLLLLHAQVNRKHSKQRQALVAGIPEAWIHWLHLLLKRRTLKRLTEAVCTLLIWHFYKRRTVSPDDSQNWLHLNVRLRQPNVFYILTCFIMLMKAEKEKLQIVKRAEGNW